MKTISIRELHMRTGWWVRQAASREPVAITDCGKRVAALYPLVTLRRGRPLPNREAAICQRSRIPGDSVLSLSARDSVRVSELLENPPRPTTALRAAAKRRRNKP
jgi:antitoxin (DNA-binding transcriptional repressor) of toxin-antitoxin stability system